MTNFEKLKTLPKNNTLSEEDLKHEIYEYEGNCKWCLYYLTCLTRPLGFDALYAPLNCVDGIKEGLEYGRF